ncbi:MAG: DnaT-like ssDNA-binding protein [Anaerolineales bacterium]
MGDVIRDVEKHPSEEMGLIADFTDVLGASETVTSAVVTATDSAGLDASATLLNGAAQVVSPKVTQPIKAGADGEDYTVLIRGITNATPAAKWDQRFLVKVRLDALTAAALITSGVTANSYLSLTDAETYFSRRLRATAWEDAGKRDKIKALLQAARDIDALPYKGNRYTIGFDSGSTLTQPLAFPRSYMVDSAGLAYVPQAIKDAQCEQAIWLLSRESTGADRRARLQAQGVSAFSVEGMTESYRAGAGLSAHPWSRLAPEAQRLLGRHVAWDLAVARAGGTRTTERRGIL